jgi:hypothetical protein
MSTITQQGHLKLKYALLLNRNALRDCICIKLSSDQCLQIYRMLRENFETKTPIKGIILE